MRRTVASFRALVPFPSEGGTAPGIIPGIDWSDHWAFEQVGIPALMITDTALFRYPHYHTAADSPDKVDYGLAPPGTEATDPATRRVSALAQRPAQLHPAQARFGARLTSCGPCPIGADSIHHGRLNRAVVQDLIVGEGGHRHHRQQREDAEPPAGEYIPTWKFSAAKRIYEEKVSGAKRDRPELTRMLDQFRDGDVVVVARLDRLARSTRDSWRSRSS